MTKGIKENPTTDARSDLVDTLKLDLIGPDNDHEFMREVLSDPPEVRYTTGYLVPEATPLADKQDEDLDEEAGPDPVPSDKNPEGDGERVASRSSFIPSSIGLSVLVPPAAEHIAATVKWGDYVLLGSANPEDGHFAMELENWAREVGLDPIPTYLEKVSPGYARIPREETIELLIPSPDESPHRYELGRGRALTIEIFTREVEGLGLQPGTRSVSVFLVNRRDPGRPKAPRYPGIAFQVEFELNCEVGFSARPNLKAYSDGDRDWDEQVSDLHYRDVLEYAVGHNVSSRAFVEAGSCRGVASAWFPEAEVEKVLPADIGGLTTSMDGLSRLEDREGVQKALGALTDSYSLWIALQAGVEEGLTPAMKKTRDELLLKADYAKARISKGIELLADDAELRLAFCLANRAMAMSARQRMPQVGDPAWRPFQLAFLLLNLPGLADIEDDSREVVDLLFFPTGGGKTEAYLGIAGTALVLRRLRNPEREVLGTKVPFYAGMAVLMRYTLRLLTLDQLGRAAALVIALEMIRLEEAAKGRHRLGSWPFEIGLWVGSGATPNRLGRRGDRQSDAPYSAYSKWLGFQNRDRDSPIPLRSCPWCGREFEKNDFHFVDKRGKPNLDEPENLVVHCQNEDCPTSDWPQLPIVTVDEPIYRRLPVFVIATVDKFAALPWTGQVGMLFGKVARFEEGAGFYGHSEEVTKGVRLEADLPPPDLIIQDELHLISGPLGTIAGIYEVAIEELSTRILPNGAKVRPKIIASTATVRRADSLIRALFGRSRAEIFPPQGPDRRDSFFARTAPSSEVPARLYVGIAAPGRSPKSVSLQVLLALLSRAKKLYDEAGGKKNVENPLDPYMTLVYYFNSLRELGASRNMIEDQVINRLATYDKHSRVYPKDLLFARRDLATETIHELSSRASTAKIAEAKRLLSVAWGGSDGVDIALATNMISVGLDITRLGLMVVNGQPKATAEYIQSTSRVGRDSAKPGLVITLFNCFKPRDRSHYERFANWHEAFYRSVEVGSVTPFAPRALERALAAALVGLVRQGVRGMAQGAAAHTILERRAELETVVAPFVDRALNHDVNLQADEREALGVAVGAYLRGLLDSWEKVAKADDDSALTLHYTSKEKRGRPGTSLVSAPLEGEIQPPLEHRGRFRANRSMRDVQAPAIIRTERLPE